jgi:hypothetical protein
VKTALGLKVSFALWNNKVLDDVGIPCEKWPWNTPEECKKRATELSKPSNGGARNEGKGSTARSDDSDDDDDDVDESSKRSGVQARGASGPRSAAGGGSGRSSVLRSSASSGSSGQSRSRSSAAGRGPSRIAFRAKLAHMIREAADLEEMVV